MRIAFVGASGTGKTTLAKMCADAFGLPINPVGSRSVAARMGFTSPYDVDRASMKHYTQAEVLVNDGELTPAEAASHAMSKFSHGDETCRGEFQRRVQQGKISWEMRTEWFVTDRTTVDDMVYSALHGEDPPTDEFVAAARAHLSRYHLVVKTPVAAFHNTDGDRSRIADLAYHNRFEQLAFRHVDLWCHELNVPVLELGGGTPDERFEFIVTSLAVVMPLSG